MISIGKQGAPGHLRFAPNSSDPEYLYFVVGQGAVDGRRNDTFGIVALATFPDGIEVSLSKQCCIPM